MTAAEAKEIARWAMERGLLRATSPTAPATAHQSPALTTYTPPAPIPYRQPGGTYGDPIRKP